jgi:hypothetical protein
MAGRQGEYEKVMEGLAAQLVELYTSTGLQNGSLTHADREKLATEAIHVWWKIYDHLVFWAQCEILGQDLLRQNSDLLAVLRDRGMLRLESERRLPEALGYYFSVSDKAGAEQALLAASGNELVAVVKLLAKAGLNQSGSFLLRLLSPKPIDNVFLAKELQSLLENTPGHFPLTERDLDNAHPTEGTRWKLEALRQVRLLVGRGLRKMAALAEVSATTRRSIDDLQQWERDLVKFSDFENDLFCTELAGELEDVLRTSHYSSIRNYQFYGSYKGTNNLERAATIAHHMRQVRPSDIVQGLRSVR